MFSRCYLQQRERVQIFLVVKQGLGLDVIIMLAADLYTVIVSHLPMLAVRQLTSVSPVLDAAANDFFHSIVLFDTVVWGGKILNKDVPEVVSICPNLRGFDASRTAVTDQALSHLRQLNR